MQVLKAASRDWKCSGIAFRVSLFLTVSLVVLFALVSYAYIQEGKNILRGSFQKNALFLAGGIAVRTADAISRRNVSALSAVFSQQLAPNGSSFIAMPLLYLIAYDKNCMPLFSKTMQGDIAADGGFSVASSSADQAVRNISPLDCARHPTDAPVFSDTLDGIYDMTVPMLSGGAHVGFLRVGMPEEQYAKELYSATIKAGLMFVGVFLIGLACSLFFARGISRPLVRMSEAVEMLSNRNWSGPLPVQGFYESNKLAHAFNHLAAELEEREANLSRGNSDLFMLHTAGLDLMESLNREALSAKIAARTEGLVRAETTALSLVSQPDALLKYIGIFGQKETVLQEQTLPIEAGGIYNWLASYGTPLLIADAQADFRLDGALMHALGIKDIIAVPLWSSNTMIGILTAINKNGGEGFSRHDLRLLTVFSSLAASALQNAALFSDLKLKMAELNAAQEQLVQSAKMAAIGELSANVAHEINNPLTSVLGYTTCLLKTSDLPDEPRRALGIMEQEILRVRKFTWSLLEFARTKPAWMTPADIAVPLRETTALVRPIAEATAVSIEEVYPPTPLIVTMNHNEMKQVFISLANNALQAMPEGGSLRIQVKSVHANELVVEFSDTGVGMASGRADRIHQPLFYAHGSGDGAGVGLAISNRIVRTHGGRIEAESSLEEGSIFRVFLPVN